MKRITLCGIGLVIGVGMAAALTLPSVWWGPPTQQAEPFRDTSAQTVSVYLSQQKQTAVYRLETYVRGVLAAEMPAAFELEALKAQAIASRTYIVKRLSAGNQTAALVTDTVNHQAFLTDDKLKRLWGEADYAKRMARIEQAVMETSGKIMTYQGAPIDAAFFSTSNGHTENADEYWTQAVPYLQSVASPWDKSVSPKYTHTRTFTERAFLQALGLTASELDTSTGTLGTHITYTTGHRIKSIKLGTRTFTGRTIREKLQLTSADFKIRRTDRQIIVKSTGYGHGIGMSQYGAQGMALSGYTAEQILKHYYKGIALEKM